MGLRSSPLERKHSSKSVNLQYSLTVDMYFSGWWHGGPHAGTGGTRKRWRHLDHARDSRTSGEHWARAEPLPQQHWNHLPFSNVWLRLCSLVKYVLFFQNYDQQPESILKRKRKAEADKSKLDNEVKSSTAYTVHFEDGEEEAYLVRIGNQNRQINPPVDK